MYRIENSEKLLYDLLSEREPHVNISHQEMPTWEEHCAFVASHPYKEWNIIVSDTNKLVGACYLSRMNEIGVFIFKAHQGKGYGTFAIDAMRIRHPGERILANVAPSNDASHKLFKKLGFRLIQVTYEWVSPNVD